MHAFLLTIHRDRVTATSGDTHNDVTDRSDTAGTPTASRTSRDERISTLSCGSKVWTVGFRLSEAKSIHSPRVSATPIGDHDDDHERTKPRQSADRNRTQSWCSRHTQSPGPPAGPAPGLAESPPGRTAGA